MRRVPAELALLALRQSGYHVTAGTLRIWVHRGHIARGRGGYDLAEILAYIDRRQAAGRRAGSPAPSGTGDPG
jgi:hypothetical protein